MREKRALKRSVMLFWSSLYMSKPPVRVYCLPDLWDLHLSPFRDDFPCSHAWHVYIPAWVERPSGQRRYSFLKGKPYSVSADGKLYPVPVNSKTPNALIPEQGVDGERCQG